MTRKVEFLKEKNYIGGTSLVEDCSSPTSHQEKINYEKITKVKITKKNGTNKIYDITGFSNGQLKIFLKEKRNEQTKGFRGIIKARGNQ